MQQRVTVIIPAYNEEKRIYSTISNLLDCDSNIRIIVVDDGSKDDTAALSQKAGAKTIRLIENKGKGNALNVGLESVNNGIVVFLDADVCETSGEVLKLIEPIRKNEADFTIGKFPPSTKPGGFGLVKRLAKYGVKLLTGEEIDSTLSGQRAFKYEAIKDCKIADGFGAELAITVDLLRKKFRLKEVEVNMIHRETGRDISGFIHRGKQFYHILKVILFKVKEGKIKNDGYDSSF